MPCLFQESSSLGRECCCVLSLQPVHVIDAEPDPFHMERIDRARQRLAFADDPRRVDARRLREHPDEIPDAIRCRLTLVPGSHALQIIASRADRRFGGPTTEPSCPRRRGICVAWFWRLSARTISKEAKRMASAEPVTDHRRIREWAEARNARPACVRGTGGKNDTGMI